MNKEEFTRMQKDMNKENKKVEKSVKSMNEKFKKK